MAAALILVILAAPPGAWRFVDEPAADGRSVVTFRTVDLAAKPAAPVPGAPAGASFGVLPLGPRGAHRVAIVWKADAVWIDADTDGQFTATERHALGDEPFATTVRIPFEKETVERTVLLRRRGDGLARAVRGYAAGPLTLGPATFPARLTDGDADGCFDNPATDRVWVDLNRDGTFDALAEQFPLGKPVTVAGRQYLVKSDPLGRTVAAVERSADTGPLTLTVSRLKDAKIVAFGADLVSEWGELVTVTAAEKAVPVPVGRYRVAAVSLRLAAGDGREWHYRFYGPDANLLTVKKNEPAALDLTAGVKLTAHVGKPHADGAVPVTPSVATAAGLTLSACARYERFSEFGPEQDATLDLEAPGSVSVLRERFGIMCNRFGTVPVKVPITADDLEWVLRFPGGPLAGDLRTALPPPKK